MVLPGFAKSVVCATQRATPLAEPGLIFFSVTERWADLEAKEGA